ncbi:alpha-glucuronidase family glycosyl hydrolase [Arcicella aquatica]|uniref:Xylan alpha-1,2-glucuronidase n=1 Tax=Arcicella aquatica TaxID=217141 RepID=A0ABU5QMB2_9BACT|nr:alpha-glucuronidase family glycosyl hydrolase [Arcicella aquatica]MEA5257874.1 alpha-glucuronidase family glycosyl hydrolase [Arcicella aquatica]
MYKKIIGFLLFFVSMNTFADDGYRLWLKYDLISNKQQRESYAHFTKFIVANTQHEIIKVATDELKSGLQGLLGKQVSVLSTSKNAGGIVLQLSKNQALNDEGFTIINQNGNVVVSGNTEKGILYGTFELLRSIQTGKSLANIFITSNPKIKLRMLNHWDNPLGTIERGYAGSSLWKWYELPENIDPRYKDYARANASIGINATVVNNVNASARFMTKEYLLKVKALADVFRPYGIQIFLSVNFAAPKILKGAKTSDPLDPQVRAWWQAKTKEIYSIIPDFGGYLVKANSEGEPGPQDFGRTHADGANMLAEALKPFTGVVIWRAFVYKPSSKDDPKGDRYKEAYNDFKPLDGQFDRKVIVQVKNGPIDFQAREPFHPLFGAMPKTPLAMEFQITQEYLGFSTNLVYLAPLFKECLESDTYVKGKGSTVAKVVDGSLHDYNLTAIAGVANTGSDRNWTGHFMSQANWYAFGRLAWNHELSSAQIADEWTKMTLMQDEKAVKTVTNILLASRENYVNFTTPLGLHHIMGQGIHYGPEPWLERSARPDWASAYYHRADSVGLGFDRTKKGTEALLLYAPEVQNQWNDPNKTPLPYLLWFHHVGWKTKLSTGNTLWDELCTRYYTGLASVKEMRQQWSSVKSNVDKEIFEDVAGRLAVQEREAIWWRDACVLYFQQYSKMPIPAPFPKPERSLEEVKTLVETYQLR